MSSRVAWVECFACRHDTIGCRPRCALGPGWLVPDQSNIQVFGSMVSGWVDRSLTIRRRRACGGDGYDDHASVGVGCVDEKADGAGNGGQRFVAGEETGGGVAVVFRVVVRGAIRAGLGVSRGCR